MFNRRLRLPARGVLAAWAAVAAMTGACEASSPSAATDANGPTDGGAGTDTGGPSSQHGSGTGSSTASSGSGSGSSSGAGIGASGSGSGDAASTGMPTTTTFAPMSLTSSLLPNPDRGAAALWFGQDMVSGFAPGTYDTSDGFGGSTMGYCTLELAPYIGTSIPSSILQQFQTSLNSVRDAGLKCMMLIGYGIYSGTDPGEHLSDIQAHATQLAPILHSNADIIPYAKAGFMGAYAQWFGSQTTGAGALTCGYESPQTCPNATVAANKVLVRDAILGAYDPLTQVGMPSAAEPYAWWRASPLTPAEAFTGTAQARVGVEDDCPMSTSGQTWSLPNDLTDFGVFMDGLNLGVTPSQLTAYTQHNAEYQAFFGEFSNGCTTAVTDCPNALSYMALFHAASFKMIGTSWSTWEDSWKANGCFTQIINQMGYRIQFDSLTHQATAVHGQSITATVQLRNVGWSRMWDPRPLELQLVSGNDVVKCHSADNLRSLPDQATGSSTLTISNCVIPSAGTYSVYLAMPDYWPSLSSKPAFAARPANEPGAAQAWDATNARFATGTSVTVL